MIEGLDTNRYDVVGSGIWINASRGRGADFTIPLLYDAVCAYVRDDDRRFDDNVGAGDVATGIAGQQLDQSLDLAALARVVAL